MSMCSNNIFNVELGSQVFDVELVIVMTMMWIASGQERCGIDALVARGHTQPTVR